MVFFFSFLFILSYKVERFLNRKVLYPTKTKFLFFIYVVIFILLGEETISTNYQPGSL